MQYKKKTQCNLKFNSLILDWPEIRFDIFFGPVALYRTFTILKLSFEIELMFDLIR
jgi:hypothetical protein